MQLLNHTLILPILDFYFHYKLRCVTVYSLQSPTSPLCIYGRHASQKYHEGIIVDRNATIRVGIGSNATVIVHSSICTYIVPNLASILEWSFVSRKALTLVEGRVYSIILHFIHVFCYMRLLISFQTKECYINIVIIKVILFK